MSIIYSNVSPGAQGGPSVFSAKFASGMSKKGHRVIYKNPQSANVALAIINVGKLARLDRNKTKLFLRIDGIYNDLYNKKFKRAIRPDMKALHNDLRVNIPKLDGVIYQSEWSFNAIQNEIVRCDKNYSIIHNSSDPNVFKPLGTRKDDGYTNLLAIGLMRDHYYMNTLIGTYSELKKRGVKVRLMLVGTMDGACKKLFIQHKADSNIKHLGSFPNKKLNQAYNMGDIFLSVRQGCSSNQTTSEAQMSGVPILTSSWGGDKEMILNEKSGIIVSGGKWDYDNTYIQNLADGVEQIIPDLAGYKKRAREHAVKNLGVDTMIGKYIKAMGL